MLVGLCAFSANRRKKKISNLEGTESIKKHILEGEPKWDFGNFCRFREPKYYILNWSIDLPLSRSRFFLGNYKTVSLHPPTHSVHIIAGKLKFRIDFMASEGWYMNFKDASAQTAASLSWKHLSYADSQHWAQQKLFVITVPKSA